MREGKKRGLIWKEIKRARKKKEVTLVHAVRRSDSWHSGAFDASSRHVALWCTRCVVQTVGTLVHSMRQADMWHCGARDASNGTGESNATFRHVVLFCIRCHADMWHSSAFDVTQTCGTLLHSMSRRHVALFCV